MTVKYNPFMTIKEIKMKIQYREGFLASKLRLTHNGRPLENERTLSDYYINEGSNIHVAPKLCGGMYHLTSGRQDFQKLPFESAMAIEETLTFQFTGGKTFNHSTLTELQESILKAQNVLSTLRNQIEEYSSPDNLPNVTSILQASQIDEEINVSDNDSDDS